MQTNDAFASSQNIVFLARLAPPSHSNCIKQGVRAVCFLPKSSCAEKLRCDRTRACTGISLVVSCCTCGHCSVGLRTYGESRRWQRRLPESGGMLVGWGCAHRVCGGHVLRLDGDFEVHWHGVADVPVSVHPGAQRGEQRLLRADVELHVGAAVAGGSAAVDGHGSRRCVAAGAR